VLAAALAVAAAAAGFVPRPAPDRYGLTFLVLLAALAVWSGLSILWSLEPDRSWSYLNRELAYLAFAVLGVFIGSLVPDAPRRVAAGLAVLFGAVIGWALLGKVAPSLGPEVSQFARLREPIGYWNGLALVCDLTLPLALWVAGRRPHRREVRVAGVLLLYASLVALALTYSRGGLVLGAAAVGLWLWLGGPLLESVGALVIASPVALALFAWAHTRDGLTADGQSGAARSHDGKLFAVALLIGALPVGWLALKAARRQDEKPVSDAAARTFVRFASAAAAGLVFGIVVVGAVRAGGPGPWLHDRAREFGRPVQLTQAPRRLTSLNSNNRWTWWKETLEEARDDPLGGAGAGAFRLVHRPRYIQDSVIEPHNLALQLLAETGILGLALGLGAGIAAVLAVRASLRRLGRGNRLAAAALAAGAFAYLLHVLIDYDWDFVALTAPALLVLGVLAGAGRPPSEPRRPDTLRLVWAAGTLVLALGIIYSLAAPWLANRRVDDATVAIDHGDLAAAVSAARDARSLNPVSLDPLFVEAAAQAARGQLRPAARLYLKATDLEPRNSETWYQLGRFELLNGAPRAAYRDLNQAYTLDRFGPVGDPCGLLDRARAQVEGKKLSCPR
jgi:tetratricopeptide (TPR) repeat protein